MRRTHKRLGSLLLVMAMLLTLLPISAMAVEGEPTPSNAGIVSEETLTTAVENAENGMETTITLGADITLANTLTIPAEKNIVLDLAGYTLSVSSDIDVIDNSGTLTVKNGTVAGNVAAAKGMAVDNLAGATLTVEQDKGKNTRLIGRSAIQDYGSSVTVYGGTIESYNRNAYWSDSGCNLVVYDGTFTSPSGSSGTGRAISANGNVTIYGGTFYAGGTSGAGDSYVNAIGMYGNGALTIEPRDGKTVTVTSETDYAVATSSSVSVKIYGGSFVCNGDRTEYHAL